jgi:hypothetical protein
VEPSGDQTIPDANGALALVHTFFATDGRATKVQAPPQKGSEQPMSACSVGYALPPTRAPGSVSGSLSAGADAEPADAVLPLPARGGVGITFGTKWELTLPADADKKREVKARARAAGAHIVSKTKAGVRTDV